MTMQARVVALEEAARQRYAAMSDAELEALVGPEACAYLDRLAAAELEALARGEPAAMQRFYQASVRWRTS